jgi:hypothetical protein
MYGQQTGGGTTQAEMAAVAIAPVATVDPLDERLGQIIRNDLEIRLDPRNVGAASRYRLDVQLAKRSSPLAITSTDTITRYNLTLAARIVLVDLATGNPVYHADTRATGSYDVQRSEYGTVVAEQATAEDAALAMSDRIATLLAVYFAGQGS